jgi:hypothetical protein
MVVVIVRRALRQSTVVVAFLLSTMSAGAAPPDKADPALATWLRSLKAPNETACCTLADCRRAIDSSHQNGYEVLIAGRWVSLPRRERVLRLTDNPTGEAVVCRQPGTTLILCFVRRPEI